MKTGMAVLRRTQGKGRAERMRVRKATRPGPLPKAVLRASALELSRSPLSLVGWADGKIAGPKRACRTWSDVQCLPHGARRSLMAALTIVTDAALSCHCPTPQTRDSKGFRHLLKMPPPDIVRTWMGLAFVNAANPGQRSRARSAEATRRVAETLTQRPASGGRRARYCGTPRTIVSQGTRLPWVGLRFRVQLLAQQLSIVCAGCGCGVGSASHLWLLPAAFRRTTPFLTFDDLGSLGEGCSGVLKTTPLVDLVPRSPGVETKTRYCREERQRERRRCHPIVRTQTPNTSVST